MTNKRRITERAERLNQVERTPPQYQIKLTTIPQAHRYRLMVRRCMEGSHLLGMAQVRYNHALDPMACETLITDCQQLPDG